MGRNNQLSHALPDSLRLTVSEHLFGGGIPILDPPLRIHRNQGIERRFKYCPRPGFAFSHHLVRTLALRDVDIHTGEPYGLPRVIVDPPPAAHQPANLAVRSDDTKLPVFSNPACP